MRKKLSTTRKSRNSGRTFKDLAPRHTRAIKGGGKATGSSGGNVSGGWDLQNNKRNV